ncbi:MAG: GYD domain-containing protein [Candidatus Omnitrophica bacterium]|nr:GYD domain-containing protein [Candidatus Omnitrophota bacterium]
MQAFVMLGKYSSEAVRDISANRTDKSLGLIKELGGKVISMYTLLGGYDVVLTAEFPNLEAAMRASLGLTILTGIGFSSYPAISVSDFDKMIGK